MAGWRDELSRAQSWCGKPRHPYPVGARMKINRFEMLPDDVKIGDVLPAFAGVESELHVGTPCNQCAGCHKEFDAVRKPRRAIRIFLDPIPLAFQYRLCGRCAAMHQRGGADREALVAGIEKFFFGAEGNEQ